MRPFCRDAVSDQVGRKKVILIGLVGYVITLPGRQGICAMGGVTVITVSQYKKDIIYFQCTAVH